MYRAKLYVIYYICAYGFRYIDGNCGLDDLEHVISTKDSLQNHLSLVTHINHAGARTGYIEGVYITVAVARDSKYIHIYIYICVYIRSSGVEIF